MHIVKTGLSLLTAAVLATSTTLALAQTCNPNIPLTKPDSRYTYNSAGDEVTDSVTNLTWKRCAEGMSWSGSSCTGTASTFIWEGALAQAASVAQTTGLAWRMPNIKELKSLVETACYGQAINQTAFPSTPTYAWSASPGAASAGDAWGVSFGDGYDGRGDKGGNYSVRLVRGQ
jgi:hypothetical protein